VSVPEDLAKRPERGDDLVPVPADRLRPSDFVEACTSAPDDLIYFVLNVGDGDTQLLLLPTDKRGSRQLVVVDVATTGKLPALLDALTGAGLVSDRDDLFPLVVGTHPHDDHIAGMPELLEEFGDRVVQYWDPAYYHPTAVYAETMRQIEDHENIHLIHPTSGTTCYFDKVKIMALSPGIGLRSRFDSYGTNINDASIALKVEFPGARVVQIGENRDYRALRDPWSLVLGADAQTTSWAQATLDFPELHRGANVALFEQLRKSMGPDPLRAQVFKVPHHGSKHGLNLELVERIDPSLSLLSCVAGGGKYNFPHRVAMEALREAREPIASSGKRHSPDHDLGIHATFALDTDGNVLGSIALMVSPRKGSSLRMWRFGDRRKDRIDLGKARELLLQRPRSSKKKARPASP
jgi:hypothetical protein